MLTYIKAEGVEFVDVRFCDLPGVMQHFTVPASLVRRRSCFDAGLMFDGSSIRGFQAIHESDMALLADPTTAVLDPFRTDKTLNVTFFIHDPLTGEAYSRDPRNVARKAEAYLAGTGIADKAFFAPEAEFYVFDDVRFETKQNTGYYAIDSDRRRLEHRPRRGGRQPRLQGQVQGRLLPGRRRSTTSPTCATRWCASSSGPASIVERAHHEVGTAGQAEINFKYDTLLKAADR